MASSNNLDALAQDRGAKPSSSMISRPRRESCGCRVSRRLSSLASISSWTRAAAVVKPTDNPRWPAPLLPTATVKELHRPR